MLERFIILYAETKPMYSFQRSKPDQYTMASLSQYVMVLGQIYDANFYFDDDAEYLYASYGDALTYAMKQNERNAPWLSTRLGKSRDHSLRLCALIQSLEMAAVVCHQVFMVYSTFNDGVANKQFFIAIVKKTNELFFPSANSQRRLSIGIEIVQSSIYFTNKLIDQYRQMFEPNKREINRMESLLSNVITPIDKKQTSIKRKQPDRNHDDEYLEDEVDDTSIQSCSKKLTNKQVRANQMSAKAVSMFNPTSDDDIKIIKLILLANAAVLTKSVWSRHPTLKNYIPLLIPALDHLIDLELLIVFDRGAIVTSNEHRFIPVYVKKMISPSCAKENVALTKALTYFKVEHSDYVATWANINVSQTITLTEDIYDLLTSAPYSTFLGDTINQWAPKSRQKSSSMISASQPNDHTEATESAILPSKTTTTKTVNFGINTISKKVTGPSNNIFINANRNDCIENTETLNNINFTCRNTAVNQQHLVKTTASTSTIPDESDVDQENCQIKQINAKHASMMNACLPPLPSGNLPTAINLMLTRQPPQKKRDK
ncbi:unnamed protein product [Rotaria magnacalcarata]|nr:unnamed protein product [Rotaria magnacalcarata]